MNHKKNTKENFKYVNSENESIKVGDFIEEGKIGDTIWDGKAKIVKPPVGQVVFIETDTDESNLWVEDYEEQFILDNGIINVKAVEIGVIEILTDNLFDGLKTGDNYQLNLSKYDGQFLGWNSIVKMSEKSKLISICNVIGYDYDKDTLNISLKEIIFSKKFKELFEDYYYGKMDGVLYKYDNVLDNLDNPTDYLYGLLFNID